MNDTRELLAYLANQAQEEFAYVPGRRWLVRDTEGHLFPQSPTVHWQPDRGALMLRQALAAWLEPRALKRWDVESGPRLQPDGLPSTVALARELEPLLVMQPEEFDADPDVVGLAGDQLVDLRTGEERKAKPSDGISKWLPAFEPHSAPGPAQCWLDALARALPDEYEREWFRRWCGYCLTGHTREHKFLFLQGPGGGGKSTIVETLRALAGGYHVGIPDNAFATGRGAPNREWLARLYGARLVTLADIPGAAWSRVGLFKALVAGDSVTARHLYEGSEDYLPTVKFIFSGNSRPPIPAADDGFARRLVLVPLEKIPPGDRDLTFPDRLRAEFEAIAAWMIAGAVEWYQCGLGTVPERWAVASRQYLAAEDGFRAWFDACLETDPAGFVQSRDLVASYNGFSGGDMRRATRLLEWFKEQGMVGIAPARRRIEGTSNPRDGVSGVRLCACALSGPLSA